MIVSRTRLQIFTGVMTGHFAFNKLLTTLGKRADPGCDVFSHHTGTADHFLFKCSAFEKDDIISGINLIEILPPKDIVNYISSTGRLGATASSNV